MKTNLTSILAALSVMGASALLSPAAMAVQPIDTPEIRTAAQNAASPREHEAVAKHYENAAAEVQAKLKEQKELLEQYQNKSYLYGKHAQDLQSHTEALVRDYEETLAETMEEASAHRRMALKQQEKHTFDAQPANTVTGL